MWFGYCSRTMSNVGKGKGRRTNVTHVVQRGVTRPYQRSWGVQCMCNDQSMSKDGKAC
jgi:hypothetical protein